MRRRLVAVVLPAALALAACGTTVPAAGTAADVVTTDGLSAPVAAGEAPVPTSPLGEPAAGGAAVRQGQLPAGRAPAGSAGGASSTGTSPDAGGAGGGSGATGGRPAVAAPGAGRGYSEKEIRIGFSISSDAARALGSAGLGVSVADQETLVREYLARVNGQGGIAGRKAVPVFYDYSAGGDINAQDQAACATWTQDTMVFAATGVRAGITGSGDTLTPCLARAGVPWLVGTGDQHKWAKYLPAMYNPAALNATREARVLVEALAGQGFFSASAKVGVVINDRQGDYSRTVKEGMEPALARLGLSIARRVVIANPQTESSNAELQMATAGVTHVLFAAPGGAAASQFMIAADSQGRTYRYGISSQDAPGLTVQALAPHRQLLNAMGYGYKPSLDVDGSNQPPQTPGMKSCFDFYTGKGYDTDSLNRAAMAIICDSVELLRAALRGQDAPTTASMADAVAALGRSLPSAGTFATAFSATQHDGAGGYRFLRYDGDRRSFRYVGQTRPAS